MSKYTLFEGETVESRLADIQLKLKNIPIEDLDTMRYYIYYRNDVQFLLELVNKFQRSVEGNGRNNS